MKTPPILYENIIGTFRRRQIENPKAKEMQPKAKTKNRLSLTQSDQRHLKNRDKRSGKKSRKQERYKKANKSAFREFEFLDIEFEPIYLLDLEPEKNYDKLLEVLELNFGKLPEGKSLGMNLHRHYLALNQLISDTETDCHIEHLGGGEFRVVIYHVMNPMGEWLTPRLNFLPKLRSRAESLFNTVINSLRIISQKLDIGRFDHTIWVHEWTEEQISELYDSGEPDDFKQAKKMMALMHKYNEGIAAKYFKMLREQSTISTEVCIRKLSHFPDDLKPISEALINLLELTNEGKKMRDFDPSAVEGFALDYSDEGLMIGEQYAWAWEYDDFFGVAEEHVDGMASIGLSPPFNWITFTENKLNIEPGNLKAELRKLFDASEVSFPARFEGCMQNFAYAVQAVYPQNPD